MGVLDGFRLDGRRALITGGSKGLGRVMAQALAEVGAEVAIVSRTLTEAKIAAKEIQESSGNKAEAFGADVTKGDQVKRLFKDVIEGFGPIDVLVNNAGINIRAPIADLKEEDWDAVLNVNLKAPFLCSQAFGPSMAERGWGRVINMGSTLSVIGLPERTPYSSAKAGVTGLTRVLALEWAQRGVTVNAICPGPFATEMNLPLLNDPAKYNAMLSRIPLGRWGDLHEIAGAVVYLASPGASFVTGTTLFVDGGWTTQ